MPNPSELPEPAAPTSTTSAPATEDGRPLTAGVAMLATAVAVISLLVGGLLTLVNMTGHVFGAWPSPDSLSQGLVGAAMLGTAPALFTVNRARLWQQARTLLYPLAVVLVGLFLVSLLDADRLYLATGGNIVPVLFSLGWLLTLGALTIAAAVLLTWQHLTPATPLAASTAPLPGWSKPALAVLGSSWLGIGAGLVTRPGFWADFVPWSTNRLDAQALGVWALALGVGILGALAEDDLDRTRPALLALPGAGAAVTLVLAFRAPGVDWSSGPALGLVCMVGGLFLAGASGRVLLARASAVTRGT
ncbi:hypothetical protein ACQEWB_47505 [Streptomyces sp. CA-249302]|uniref:hypothetical protein n=1 Tax=Streptomyces sp. CA-249302 TaxID=3240058 RepID=UPI003D8B26DD